MSASSPFRLFSFFPICACALLLNGCAKGEEATEFAPACPVTDVPQATADLYAWTPGKSTELGHLRYRAALASVNGTCETGPRDAQKRGLTRVSISERITGEVGPAQEGGTLEIPYFIAVLRQGEIRDKHIYRLSVPLKEGQTRFAVQAPTRFLDLPTGRQPQESAYSVETGFQLTRDQLTYNREHLPNVSFIRSGF